MDRIAQSIISKADGGKLLLDFLAARFTYLPREDWEKAIADGIITVNGSASASGASLSPGDLVRFSPENFREPETDARVQIVYEDEDALVADKGSNLPVHPSGRFFKRTLWYMLKESRPGIRIVTRLDRETSGLVLIAKTAAEARRLQERQAAGEIGKRYRALVHGSFPERLAAKGWLVDDSASAVRKKRAYIDETEARPDATLPARAESCETIFERLETNGRFSLVGARLVTGRTHQIRATLCSLGFPLVGDKLYGPDETLFVRFAEGTLSEADRRTLILPHQALHCSSLAFPSSSGKRVEVSSKPPFSLID